MARRVAWAMLVSPPPPGVLVLLVCGPADCMNPAHMRLSSISAKAR